MSILQIGTAFAFGMMAMWNFMRTAYVYNGTPSFYALDVVAMGVNFFLAWVCCRMVLVWRPHQPTPLPSRECK